MNNFIVVLLSLLVALIASDLLPEEAYEKMNASFDHHCKFNDTDFFDQEFYIQLPDGTKWNREKSIAWVLQGCSVTSHTKSHLSVFTDDGMLKIKIYSNNKMAQYFLAKPNRNIEGGYKLYRLVAV